MRYALLIVLTCSFAMALPAQTTVRLTGGATKGTALVTDILGGPVSLGTGVPPTIALSVAHPIGTGYRALLEGRVGRGALRASNNGETSSLATLTTVGVMLLVDGRVSGTVRWEVGAGVLSYRPSERSGTFAQGGPNPWLLGAGLSWTRPLSAGLSLAANARYDFHQFRSRQLDSRGYSQYQSVHRVGLGIGVERSF